MQGETGRMIAGCREYGCRTCEVRRARTATRGADSIVRRQFATLRTPPKSGFHQQPYKSSLIDCHVLVARGYLSTGSKLLHVFYLLTADEIFVCLEPGIIPPCQTRVNPSSVFLYSSNLLLASNVCTPMYENWYKCETALTRSHDANNVFVP